MALSAATLERLGITDSPEAVEALVLEAMESVLAGQRFGDAQQDLTPAEAAALRRGGLDLSPMDLGAEDPLRRGATQYAAILATSLTTTAAAQRLGVDSSRIRQRLAVRTMYGIRTSSGWRLPVFQFDGQQLLPNVERVLPRLRSDLHPLAVHNWFNLPNPDLVRDDDEASLSPREWLRLGLDPEFLAALAECL